MVLVPPGNVQRGFGVGQSVIRIDRGFALAAREVTVGEFRRFRKESARGQDADHPISGVSWYDAAAYCNWLSERDGIPEDQWCYKPNAKGQYAEGMRMAPNYLSKTGYRLPIITEWEYACRAGSFGQWSVGDDEDLLPKCAWFLFSSRSQRHPVGTLRPNDLGLFDMHGSVWEWCQDREESRTSSTELPSSAQGLSDGNVTNKDERFYRGGGFTTAPLHLTSQSGFTKEPSGNANDIGFRPARTFP
jgi:formylglycine-generating enzyme required for sulfatase activity